MRFPNYHEHLLKKRFSELACFKKGPFGSALKKEIFVPKSDTTIKVYEQQNAINKDWKLERYFITSEYYEKMKSFTVNPGDIIVSCAGTIGEIYTLPMDAEKGVINQALMIVRPNEKIINRDYFIYIFEKMIDNFTLKFSNGSAIKNIPPFADLKNYITNIPSMREQNKIVDMLDKIDERISTQSKIIEDIETLRKWIINQQFARTATNTIGEFIEQTSERNKTKGVERVLSVSNKYGFINQSEQFEDREVASDDRTNYKIVRRNDFAFNPARINVGSIAKLGTYDIGIVSPMYICFKSNNKNLDADYLSNFFSSNSFKNALNKRLEGSVRQCLQFDALCDIKLFVPSLNEQISFVSKIKAITRKLTIEKDILSAYKKQKAYLLSNMFI